MNAEAQKEKVRGKEKRDFVSLKRNYDDLKPGQQAELRRVAKPDDLRDYATLYRLFPGEMIHPGHVRVAFLMPWCEQEENPKELAKQWLKAKINETRLLQMARAGEPLDLIQFRRLVMQAKPKVDWTTFGDLLWYWGPRVKRQLVEQFYLAKHSSAKGDHS